MRSLISSLFCLLLVIAAANAQTARVQIINNSPADAFDLYVGDQLVADNFAFRSATPYITVPAGSVNVSIAPANSVSAADGTLIPIPFPDGSTSVMMATGLQGGSPQFDLKSFWTASETAANAANTDVLFYHGSPNAGPIDVITGDVTLIDDFSYGYYHGYYDLSSGQYTVKLTHPTDATQVIGSYILDVAPFAGQSMIVMGSGVVGSEPSFHPWAVLSNGTTFALPLSTSSQPGDTSGLARVQFVHNAPSATVDVYANGELLINDFAYKTATPFIDVPAGTATIAIADRNSTAASEAVATTTLSVGADQQQIVFVNGNLDPAVLTAPTNLSLVSFDAALQEAPALDQASVLFYNGMMNGASIDVSSNGTMWADNTAANTFGTGYTHINAATPSMIEVNDGNGTSMGMYNVDLSWWAGRTAVIFAGPGYVDPSTTELWVALSNGGTFPLQQVINLPGATARVQLIHNAPTATVDVYVNGQMALNDFAWRTATPFMDLPAGQQINVAVAPANSTSEADALVTLPINLTPGKTYIAVADGMMDNDATTPDFAVNFMDLGQEFATDANNVDVVYYNGMMNGTATDLMLGDVVSMNDASFGSFGSYMNLTPGTTPFVFSLTDGSDNSDVIGAYSADFSYWKGGSAVIFSGRGYQDQNADQTELWVALSNGGTYPLPVYVSNPLIVSGGLPVNYGPNPAVDQFNVNVVLPANMDVQTQIQGPSGDIVVTQNFGQLPEGQNALQFNVGSLPTGLYYLTMTTNAGRQTIPVMVKRD